MIDLLPLSGMRILDLTLGWAGAYCSRLLADLGAEVIKVEPPRSLSPLRRVHASDDDAPRAYNRSAFFNHNNRNKLACTLDLGHPEGKTLFLQLVALADAVIESSGSGTLEEHGLRLEALQAANPDILLVAIRGWDDSGAAEYAAPDAWVASGLVSLTGYTGGEPWVPGFAYSQAVSGMTAAAALLTALWHRRLTGLSACMEVVQDEAMLNLIGEYIVGFSVDRRQPSLMGNRDTSMAPHGVFPCAGEDRWVAIAVATDAEFAALCRVLGRPGLATDPRFADVVSRYQHQAELEPVLCEWTRARSPDEAAAVLQAAGISAAPVLTVADLFQDKQLRARDFFEPVAHPEAGTWEIEGPVWKLSRTPVHIRLPGPRYAEHNAYVFHSLLGLDEQEMARLTEEGVISSEPGLDIHH